MAVVARAPDLGQARARRLRGPIGTAAAIGVAAVALHLRDPHQRGSWGLCPFKAITGWDCPGCGGLRAVNDLGDGQVVAALHSNLLLVVSLPVLAALWAMWLRRGWSGAGGRAAARWARPALLGYAVLALAFTIFRNTPWGSAWHAD